MNDRVIYVPIAPEHVGGVIQLCRAEGWPSFQEDAEVTWSALTSPGTITYVALIGGSVVGFAQLQTDGHIQAHLSTIAVSHEHRQSGIGRRLIEETFRLSGARRIDLVCEGPEPFYQSFAHRRFPGYRIYPQYEQADVTDPAR